MTSMPETSRADADHGEVTQPDLPLVVDLDGTLIKTDLLFESTVRLLRGNLLYVFLLPLWLLKGKHILKAEIARRVSLDASTLPYQEEFLDFLQEQRLAGRSLVLATASHIDWARPVADFLGIFDRIIASDQSGNIAGHRKKDVLVQTYGEQGFDYAGNAHPDLAIWPHARKAILVNPERTVVRQAHSLAEVQAVYSSKKPLLRVILRAIRVHQWVKNLLIFVPLLAAHAWSDGQALLNALLAFIAFCFSASAIYLANDAIDLDSDRAHARKKHRPLAAGDLSLPQAALLGLVLLLAGVGAASLVSSLFVLALLTYIATTTAYSFVLKTYVLIDILTLAALYTLRVIAGAVAVSVFPSFWLMAFSMFLFASLALVKRCAELESLHRENRLMATGRDYRVSDIQQLTSFGIAAGMAAVIVLAFYIHSDDVITQYRYPQVLWLICPLLLYWIGRMWIKSGRGEMHDDPIVYSAKDKASWVITLSCTILLFIAI